MNTPISFEIKQLLYDKGWRYELGFDETGYRVEHSLAEQRWNEGNFTYVDITIAEVVMWLYEKHGVWIYAERYSTLFRPYAEEIGDERFGKWEGHKYNSPTEAYEAAILYTLNNLI